MGNLQALSILGRRLMKLPTVEFEVLKILPGMGFEIYSVLTKMFFFEIS